MGLILAVLGPEACAQVDEGLLDRMMGPADDSEERRARIPGAILAARRERHLVPVLGSLGLTEADGNHCLFEGSLYYQRDLHDRLKGRGVQVRSQATQADLVLSAYRIWGSAVTDVLEGDYSFVVWDSRVRRAFVARSYPGPYPLYYATWGSGLLVSTSIDALLAHPHVSRTPQLVPVVEAAAGLLFEPHSETGYRDVQRVHGGWAFEWSDGSLPSPRRHWQPLASTTTMRRDDAAAELRAVLAAAVSERSDADAPTAVWLSGGFDSTAVFGAAMNGGSPESYLPVSISYPEGDIGREDHFIVQTAGAWDRPVRWLEIDRIPPRDDLAAHAAGRAEPFVHAFDTWNAALARASGCVGARVALGGDGGDQLFTAPPLHLVDHLWAGRWRTFYRQWRGAGGKHLAPALGWALRMGFPDGLRALAGSLRGGREPVDPLAAKVPDWFAPGFLEERGVLERAQVERPRGFGSRLAEFELERVLCSPFFSRTTEAVAAEALRHGVVQRSPLWDRRVVELAAARPAVERCGAGETKHLLRDASRGLVPDTVLAPRSKRTGTPDRFFHRLMRERYEPLLDQLIQDSILVRSGAVLQAPLARAMKRYLEGGQFFLGAHLSFTFEAELWLRGRA